MNEEDSAGPEGPRELAAQRLHSAELECEVCGRATQQRILKLETSGSGATERSMRGVARCGVCHWTHPFSMEVPRNVGVSLVVSDGSRSSPERRELPAVVVYRSAPGSHGRIVPEDPAHRSPGWPAGPRSTDRRGGDALGVPRSGTGGARLVAPRPADPIDPAPAVAGGRDHDRWRASGPRRNGPGRRDPIGNAYLARNGRSLPRRDRSCGSMRGAP